MSSVFTNKKFQCKDCIYTYDPKKGDISQNIPPGTEFKDLPKDWICPVCKANKRRFVPY